MKSFATRGENLKGFVDFAELEWKGPKALKELLSMQGYELLTPLLWYMSLSWANCGSN
jgi:hypothetical protein